MGTYITIFASMLICYYLLNLIMHTLPEVEAGPISGLKSTGCQRVTGNIPASYKKRESNGSLTIYRRFIVRGKCMAPKGIKEGGIVDVRIFNRKEHSNLRDNLSEGKVVLIYLNDEKFRGYKLRIIKELRQDAAITFYYNDGEEKESSSPHLLKDIIGVVEA